MKKFVRREPEEGTPTFGVVFYILHTNEIKRATGLEPIGYVVDMDYKCPACGAESEDSHSRACHRTLDCNGDLHQELDPLL